MSIYLLTYINEILLDFAVLFKGPNKHSAEFTLLLTQIIYVIFITANRGVLLQYLCAYEP